MGSDHLKAISPWKGEFWENAFHEKKNEILMSNNLITLVGFAEVVWRRQKNKNDVIVVVTWCIAKYNLEVHSNVQNQL